MRSGSYARLLVLLALYGCVEKGDVNVENEEPLATCNSACEHLQAETFGSCAKWTDYDDCVAECQDHAPTAAGLDCVSNADTCEEFMTCDSTYDVF